ncbi:universal stress protein [Companilactobacillus nuruki]|uniref:UspA domain-containing protein n=1 Tax=Companilactobacillus nuruki TaxID=1993540 RepID=A0A2N7AVN7_9LACO|nr:universal stress protein [Companilactobacillus nuruki]PMD72248.1 hypothetical protein CBP76_03680 [Companilactobacillus nuruki]
MFENILIALDGSKNSYDALNEALILAKKFNTKLYVVSVVNIANLPTNVGVSYEPNLERELSQDAQIILNNSQRIIESHKIDYEMDLLSGEPRDELIDFANRKQIGLVILGKSGVHALERFFVGSVTRYISEHFNGNVLIVS